MNAAIVQSFYESNEPYTEHTLLMAAAIRGDEKATQRYLRQRGQQDKDGKTALMFAAENGHTGCIKMLAPLECGMKDSLGRTALMHAAIRGFLGPVQMLLEHEAGLTCSLGWTALVWALDGGDSSVIDLLCMAPGECLDHMPLVRSAFCAEPSVTTKLAARLGAAHIQEARRWMLAEGRADLLPLLIVP